MWFQWECTTGREVFFFFYCGLGVKWSPIEVSVLYVLGVLFLCLQVASKSVSSREYVGLAVFFFCSGLCMVSLVLVFDKQFLPFFCFSVVTEKEVTLFP